MKGSMVRHRLLLKMCEVYIWKIRQKLVLKKCGVHHTANTCKPFGDCSGTAGAGKETSTKRGMLIFYKAKSAAPPKVNQPVIRSVDNLGLEVGQPRVSLVSDRGCVSSSVRK